MTHVAVELLDKKISTFQKQINLLLGQHLYSVMLELLSYGRINLNSPTHVNGGWIIEPLLRYELIGEKQASNGGESAYMLTDLGYLFCLRTSEIWDHQLPLNIDEHSLIVLNPNDYDQDDGVYYVIGISDDGLLLRDQCSEKLTPTGEKIYHLKVRGDEIIHATIDEIRRNCRKLW